jgi:hypothetical protein
MPRKNNTEATPKDAPKSLPKGRTKTGSKRVPITEPEQAPKQQPRRTPRSAPVASPIVAPEQTLDPIRVYSLPRWEEPGPHFENIHPRGYGNGGKALGSWFTAADAEEGIRTGGLCEDTPDKRHFAFVRVIDNKVGTGKQWHEKIIPLEEIEMDGDPDDSDLALIDPEDVDLDDPELLRARMKDKIEIARLRAQIEARNNNGHSPSPMMERLFERLLSEKLERPDPLEELVEREEKIERLRSVVAPPRRESSTSAPVPQKSDDELVMSAIARNPQVVDKVMSGITSKFLGSESGAGITWEDVAMEAVKSGQASGIVQGVLNFITNVGANLLRPAQPVQQALQPPAPAVQPPQQAQTAPQVAPAETPALSANDQQQQAAQPQVDQGPMQMAPVDALVYSLIGAMENQAPITEAKTLIDLAIVRNPFLRESIDELINLPDDQVLALLAAYHPPVAQMSHAKTWLNSLINALTDEGGEFDEVTEVGKGEVKL